VMAAADAATATLTNVFMGRVASFEKLSLGQVASGATNSVDLSNINGISYVVSAGGAAGASGNAYNSYTSTNILGMWQAFPAGVTFTLYGRTITTTAAVAATDVVSMLATGTAVAGATVSGTLDAGVTLTAGAGNTQITVAGATVNSFIPYTGSAGALTLTKMANAGTLELTAAAAGTTTVTMTDATGTADSFNIITKNDGATNFGTVAVAGVETVNITATDTDTTTTTDTHTLTVSGSAAKSIVASGNAKLTLTSAGTALTSVDASAMSGTFTFSSAVASVNIKGGSGADALTASGIGAAIDGGAGNDTIVVTGDYAVITGGAGNDTFDVSDKTSNVNAYNTIADFTVGDSIKFATGASLFKATRVSLPSDTAVFQDFANAAIASSTDGQISWFQFGGNTYIVQNATGGSADQFTNNVDIIVKLSGLIDLSSGTFSTSALTLQITGG
jgi:S-layer protein